jgi:hypothetical protein
MTRKFLFADEAGCFAFKRGGGASRYYIVCTVIMESCDIGHDLLALRRRLSWEGRPIRDFFHCSPEKQEVRDEVFAVIQKHDFSIQATVMEKSKAQPQTRTSEDRFYKYGWLYHLRYSSGLYLRPDTELHVTAATIGTKKKRIAFEDSIRDVCKQIIPAKQVRTAFWPCETDPCLQVADYCTWAIQRKWESESKDVRSYELIKDRITYEYDLWQKGSKHYF